MTQYSLAQLTFLKASPPDLIRIAGEAGYNYVGLRLFEVTGGDAWPLASEAALLRETKAASRSYGVGVLDVELVKLTPELQVSNLRPTIEVAAELGVRHILTQAHDTDWTRLVDNFSAVCDLLHDYGMVADVEFLTWTDMRCVDDVSRLLRASGRNNVGIMIDTLHYHRSDCGLDQFDGLPAEWFKFIQICDAQATPPTSVEGLIFTAREDRLIPGEGGLDLVGVLRRLPEDVIVALEIPNTKLAGELGDIERARRALEGTKVIVERARAERLDPSSRIETALR